MAKKKTASPKPAPKSTGKPITHADVRMYRIGTGDCFAIKFFSGETETFTMMIDCGAWSGDQAVFERHIKDLKAYLKDKVDVLVVTHEHKDHVLGFERCADLFTNDFKVGKIWMSWAERDGDDLVEGWKKELGQKKKALAAAAQKLSTVVHAQGFEAEMRSLHRGEERLKAHKRFTAVLKDFADLQMSLDSNGLYAGPLAGMKIVKEKIAKGGNGEPAIAYWAPGQIIENIAGLEGVRIYVLGPPQNKASIAREDSSDEGETYDHNKDLAKDNAFAAAANALGAANTASLLPFDVSHEALSDDPIRATYTSSSWRNIDHDWLLNAGSLALRINTGLNNLSLVLAIEFEKSGRVMLFPGDAEYGSWASWHDIRWKEKGRGKHDDGTPKHLTEDLLNRTVFYKVAHHLSHNGTAKRRGLEMMTHDDLAAMATLDYAVISETWKSTMPNRAILADLLTQTRGRLMVLRDDGLFFDAKQKVPLADKIGSTRAEMSAAVGKAFKKAHQPPDKNELFIALRVLA
jgi:Metallo-beta-lactamase superfamily